MKSDSKFAIIKRKMKNCVKPNLINNWQNTIAMRVFLKAAKYKNNSFIQARKHLKCF